MLDIIDRAGDQRYHAEAAFSHPIEQSARDDLVNTMQLSVERSARYPEPFPNDRNTFLLSDDIDLDAKRPIRFGNRPHRRIDRFHRVDSGENSRWRPTFVLHARRQIVTESCAVRRIADGTPDRRMHPTPPGTQLRVDRFNQSSSPCTSCTDCQMAGRIRISPCAGRTG